MWLKKCENCGTMCERDVSFCPNCGEEFKEATLDGMRVTDIASFVDKNGARYMEIFRKNEGKKRFIHTNWAAFFLGIYWFFYRKMYKWGIISLVLTLLISVAFCSLGIVMYKDELSEALEVYGVEAENLTVEIGDTNDIGAIRVTNGAGYNAASGDVAKVIIKMVSLAVIAEFAAGLIISLFADCIYYQHIKKNRATGGGVSWLSVIAAGVIMIVYSDFLSPLVASLLFSFI